MDCTTSSGMSLHGLNGDGSVVSTTGHLIDVVTLVIGMSSASTLGAPAGSVCQTTITAVINAPSTETRRSLAAITPLVRRSDPAGSVAGGLQRPGGSENLF